MLMEVGIHYLFALCVSPCSLHISLQYKYIYIYIYNCFIYNNFLPISFQMPFRLVICRFYLMLLVLYHP
ncbi:hypothetical protein V1511DRAFT_504252 [Dipodascopsis uninucleata]